MTWWGPRTSLSSYCVRFSFFRAKWCSCSSSLTPSVSHYISFSCQLSRASVHLLPLSSYSHHHVSPCQPHAHDSLRRLSAMDVLGFVTKLQLSVLSFSAPVPHLVVSMFHYVLVPKLGCKWLDPTYCYGSLLQCLL